ncbi:MAG: hypothetical protein AAF092_07600 [Pseudomonadota bacterium]
MKLSVKRAGELVSNRWFRRAMLRGRPIPGLRRVTPRGEAQAGYTEDNVLIITGSSSFFDYAHYNLRPNRFVPHSEGYRRITSQFGYAPFHKGFLLHASEVMAFVGDDLPDFIVGHSLGAASAQIVGMTLNIPTITFASPQTVARRFLDQPALRQISHPQWNILNIAWRTDIATRGYRFLGMRCLGFREVLEIQGWRNRRIDHFASDYLRLLRDDADKGPGRKVPDAWPDRSYAVPKLV